MSDDIDERAVGIAAEAIESLDRPGRASTNHARAEAMLQALIDSGEYAVVRRDADMREKAIKTLDRSVEKKSHAAGVAAYEEFMEAAANVDQLGGKVPAEMRFAKAWAKAIVTAMEAAGVVFGASDGWRDIESAPHGEAVLLYSPPTRFNSAEFEVGPYSTGENVGPTSTKSFHSWATRWRPLRAPPKGSDDE